MPQFIDRTGERFGNWTVIKRAENKGKRTRWLVECDCGALRIYRIDALQEGRAKGCRECTRTLRHSYPDLYDIWRGIKKRCLKPNDAGFKNYGGRGISICDKWKNSFDSFIADMGERPSPKHSIDRIDNDGDYRPENCRWATRKEQCRNYRGNHIVVFEGREMCLADLSDLTRKDYFLLRNRLQRGYTVNEAVFMELGEKRNEGNKHE